LSEFSIVEEIEKSDRGLYTDFPGFEEPAKKA
jgi:hypothetical protein